MTTISTHSKAAKLIRAELKTNFPKIKFRVSSRSYAGGNSIDINWDNGILTEHVKKIVNKYQYGHFDGMYDLYEMSNCREDIPQVKYVFCNRNITNDIEEKAFNFGKSIFSFLSNIKNMDESSEELFKQTKYWTARNYLEKYLRKIDLSNDLTFDLLHTEIFK